MKSCTSLTLSNGLLKNTFLVSKLACINVVVGNFKTLVPDFNHSFVISILITN